MMKKQTNFFLTMALAIMTVFNGFAQTHDLKPLYQLFTSSTCAPCTYGNFVLDGVLEENPEEYALIKYQVNWPGSGDPYYIQAAGDRVNYYGVGGVPQLFINNEESIYPGDMTQEIFEDNIGGMTSMGIQITTAEITEAGLINVDVELEVDTDYPAGLTLQVVVVERITTGNVGNNGETEFHNVMLHMFPDANGTGLGALTVGNNETFSFNYNMSTTFMEQASDLSIVAFVQDDSDKAIIQSEMIGVNPLFETYIATFTVGNCAGLAVEDAEVTLEVAGKLVTDENGELVYEGLTNGIYNYSVQAAGLFPANGSITIADNNINEVVALDVPTSSFYEDFESEIPADWTIHVESTSDGVNQADGEAVFFRWLTDVDMMLMLVTPELTMDGADVFSFDLGKGDAATSPVCGFGYLTNPDDPNTYVELETYATLGDMVTYDYDVSELTGTKYFAWKHNGATGPLFDGSSLFHLDNVILDGETLIVPPAGLLAELENIDVILNWSDYGCAEVDNFSIYRSFEGDDFELVGTSTEETYADMDLDEGTYAYYITVTVDAVESLTSNTVVLNIDPIVVPPAPMNLTLELDGFYGITLNWDAYSKGFDYYSVYRSVDAGDYVIVAPNLTETTYSETDLEDALYEYYVTVTVDGVESLASDVVAMLITSLNNVEANNTKVYPNPASNMINIASDLTIENLSIFNQAGQLVKIQKVNNSSFKQDVSDLPKGIYMIQLKTENTIITKRIIKD